jgi:phage terminase large subunit
MWRHPGAQGAIVRKTYKSLPGSALQTFENKILPVPPTQPSSRIRVYGGIRPERYIYPNRSVLWIGGMDNPDKILSSERDIIYINQAEELSIEDYEKLTTRATGRAGNAPQALVISDCNPGPPNHWILQRRDTGVLTMIESRHEDNPTLYDPMTSLITERGKRTMAVLDALTGVRYYRLRKGLWVAAEGIVYEEFDRAVHVIPRFEIPLSWQRFISIDFGYTIHSVVLGGHWTMMGACIAIVRYI